MKKIVLLMYSLFFIVGCTTDDTSNTNAAPNEQGNIPTPPGEPNNPNRSYNLPFSMRLEFVNAEGDNLFDVQNPIYIENELDVDVYGVNGYENMFPVPVLSGYGNSVYFYEDINPNNIESRMLTLTGYLNKSEAEENILNERKWLKYKISFPDNTVYEIKVNAELKPYSSVDFYATQVYINDELFWQQIEGYYPDYIGSFTIIK